MPSLIYLPLLQTCFSILPQTPPDPWSRPLLCPLHPRRGFCDLLIVHLPPRAPGLGIKPLLLAFSGLGPGARCCPAFPPPSQFLWLWFPGLSAGFSSFLLCTSSWCYLVFPWLQLPATKPLLQPGRFGVSSWVFPGSHTQRDHMEGFALCCVSHGYCHLRPLSHPDRTPSMPWICSLFTPLH